LGIFGKGKKKDAVAAEAPQDTAAASAAPAAPSSDFATFASMEDYVATLPGPSMTNVRDQKADSEAA
jgi:hypothetical protein